MFYVSFLPHVQQCLNPSIALQWEICNNSGIIPHPQICIAMSAVKS